MQLEPSKLDEQKRIQIEFQKEEFKLLFQTGIQNDDRMLKIFSGATTIAVSLTSAIGSYLLKDHRMISTAEAYISLAPILIILPSFLLLIGLRQDMFRIGAYLYVFYEDLGFAWGKNLTAFRLPGRSSESMDTIPFTFWCLGITCFALFYYLLSRSQVDMIRHSWSLVASGGMLVHLSKRWKAVPTDHHKKCVEGWLSVKSTYYQ